MNAPDDGGGVGAKALLVLNRKLRTACRCRGVWADVSAATTSNNYPLVCWVCKRLPLLAAGLWMFWAD